MNRRATMALAMIAAVGVAGSAPALAAKPKPRPLSGTFNYTDVTPDPTVTANSDAASHCHGNVPASPADTNSQPLKVKGKGILTVVNHPQRSGGGQVVTTATKVNIKPLEDRIVIQVLESEQTTASGIVIPDTAKEKPQEGKVLAVGPGRFEDGQRAPMDVKEGDTVIFSKYGGTEVKLGTEEYLILSARDVLAVVDK